MNATFKKVLTLVLVAALSATIAIGGTLAYLTNEQEDINVMTTGNVKIEQLEYERVLDENGMPVEGEEDVDFTANYGITQSYKLQPFTQNKPAYPAFYTEGGQSWDAFQQLWNQIGAPGSNDLFHPSMTNVIDKFVFVKNTGSFDCYFRTIIAIECPEGLPETAIHTSFNGTNHYDFNGNQDGAQTAAGANKFYVEIEDTRYLVYTDTHLEALKPGEVSRPSLLQVFLDPAVTNEDCALFGEEWDIIAISQAVQAGGAQTKGAHYALNTAFGEVTAQQAAEWLGGVVTEPFALVTVLNDNDVLKNFDGDAIVLDKGLTIDTTGSAMGLDLGKIPLDTAYQFEPYMSAEEGDLSEYADWHADFVVSVDKDIPAYGIALAGYYDAWCSFNDDKWVALAVNDVIPAGTKIRLVHGMGGDDMTVSYRELCEYGNDGIGFLCGAVALKGKTIDNKTVEALTPGTTLTVELRLYKAEGRSVLTETGEYITTGTYTYTFK